MEYKPITPLLMVRAFGDYKQGDAERLRREFNEGSSAWSSDKPCRTRDAETVMQNDAERREGKI